MNETAPEQPQTRRWLKPLLFASLAVNLLVAGVVLGAFLSPDGPRSRSEQGPARGIIGEPFIRALPKDDRRALVRDVMNNRDNIQESRESLRQRFQSFLAVLRTDPFDTEEATRLLREQRQVAVKRQEIGEALLMKRLEEMTPDERAAYADALEKSLRRLRKR